MIKRTETLTITMMSTEHNQISLVNCRDSRLQVVYRIAAMKHSRIWLGKCMMEYSFVYMHTNKLHLLFSFLFFGWKEKYLVETTLIRNSTKVRYKSWIYFFLVFMLILSFIVSQCLKGKRVCSFSSNSFIR